MSEVAVESELQPEKGSSERGPAVWQAIQEISFGERLFGMFVSLLYPLQMVSLGGSPKTSHRKKIRALWMVILAVVAFILSALLSNDALQHFGIAAPTTVLGKIWASVLLQIISSITITSIP